MHFTCTTFPNQIMYKTIKYAKETHSQTLANSNKNKIVKTQQSLVNLYTFF